MIRDLRNLPADLAGEAAHIVEAAANAAAVTVRSEYGAHRVTGELQDGVSVEHRPSGPYGAGARLRSKAPHAWLFDHGSQARHWRTGKSTGAMWEKRPPTHVFVRAVIRERRRMWDALRQLLLRHGATRVTGEP